MRRLPGILLLTGATLVVIVALLVSGLRLVLPHLDSWRPQVLAKIESATGVPVDVSRQRQLAKLWPDAGCPGHQCQPERWRLSENQTRDPALDVWQSLLHMRWQFRDLTFISFSFDQHADLWRG